MSPLSTYLIETLVTLVAVVGLAVLVLVGGRKLGLGRSAGPLELVGRLSLDPRRAVYLVKVGNLIYVVAASEGGIVRLGELEAGAVTPTVAGPLGTTERRAGFRAVLDRLRGAPRASGAQREPPAPEADGGQQRPSGGEGT